jgi:hypothetical protein
MTTTADTWPAVRPEVEPDWGRSREDAQTAILCAECLISIQLPANQVTVLTPRGRFPIPYSGAHLVRMARGAAGDGHQLEINGTPVGLFAETELRGAAACGFHVLDMARYRGPDRH